ncbi:MAG: DNA-methyltransferase [Prochlorothrix sp.]
MESSVIQGDCLEIMRELPDSSVDLICTDPPYFKVKKDWWDKQWDKPSGFLAWMDQLAEQWHRILKPNGSLYCFASPKMSARVEVKLGDRFCVLSNIVWVKPDPGSEINKGAGRSGQVSKEGLRQWFPLQERIIFAEHYGADNIAKGEAGYQAKCDELRGFVFEPLRAYLDGEFKASGASLDNMPEVLGFKSGAWIVKHYIEHQQWRCPTPEHYTKLQQAFPGYFTREYEDLRREYEDLRRPFSVTADVPYTDVWTFPTVQAYKGKHPCEKPAAMLEHIISASSRPDAVVLDCFAGSGSTLVAAKKLGRSYIGIEIDPHWASVCRQRLGDFTTAQPTLEERVAWLETQVAAQGRKIKRIEDSGQLNLFNQSS